MFYETKWLLRRWFGRRGLKKHQKVMNCQQKSRFSFFPQGHSKTETQKAPNGAPREAPGRPRAPKTAPRGARSKPRGAQDHPGAEPNASKEPFESPFWPHVGSPGLHFRAFEASFFEARAQSATQTNTLFEITGQKVFRARCGPDVQRPLSTKLLK